jgi:hypothetical protein
VKCSRVQKVRTVRGGFGRRGEKGGALRRRDIEPLSLRACMETIALTHKINGLGYLLKSINLKKSISWRVFKQALSVVERHEGAYCDETVVETTVSIALPVRPVKGRPPLLITPCRPAPLQPNPRFRCYGKPSTPEHSPRAEIFHILILYTTRLDSRRFSFLHLVSRPV